MPMKFPKQLLAQKELYLEAKRVYYLSEGKNLMTDDEFDTLEDLIRQQDPKWKGFSAGTSAIKKLKTKEPLPVPIFSLDKYKSHNVQGWLDRYGSDNVVLSDKLDGASMEIVYKNFMPYKCFTRGNGKVGGNISYLLPHLKIPQKINKADAIIRCEGLFTLSAFQKYKNDFDSARNAASGIMNRKEVHKSVRDLSVMVIQVLEPNMQMSKGLAWAKSQGFAVVPHKVIPASRLNGSNLDALLDKRLTSSKFRMDGMVLHVDKRFAHPTNGNPSHAIAFKKNVGFESAPITTVTGVEWNLSKRGVLKPVALYKPVEWDGSSLTRASAFNAKFVLDNGIGKGAKVKILRSGEIIPIIVEVLKKAEPDLPDPAVHGEYEKRGVEFVLVDPASSDVFRIKVISSFFSTIGVEFMKERTIAKLYDYGFTNIRSFTTATAKDFMKVPGIQQSSATKFVEAIQSVLNKGIDLVTLMDASGVFPKGIGSTRLNTIKQHYDLLDLCGRTPSEQVELVSKLEGFSTITARQFAKGGNKFLKWLKLVKIQPINTKWVKPKKAALKSSALEGVGVTFTGFRDKVTEQVIIENGGSIVPFGSRTKVLLVSPTGKQSTKVDVAKEKGIPVMTVPLFMKKYKLS